MKTLERLRELSETWRNTAKAGFADTLKGDPWYRGFATGISHVCDGLDALLTAAGQEGVHITWDVDGNRIVTQRGQEGAAPSPRAEGSTDDENANALARGDGSAQSASSGLTHRNEGDK